jgi:magnesium transporter
MLAGYSFAEGKLRSLNDLMSAPQRAAWIDMLRPTPEEDKSLETALDIDIPTLEEMQEIEVSSRLYTENNAAFMTALVLSHADGDNPTISPVTFILRDTQLITVRYEEPRAFSGFAARVQKSGVGGESADLVLVGLLESIVERLADVLERTTRDIDRMSRDIFHKPGTRPTKSRDYQKTLIELGSKGDLASNMRDSLVTLSRVFSYVVLFTEQREDEAGARKHDKDVRARLKSLARDAASLTDHVSFVSQKITFLLEATLGMISLEQNQVIKIFSIAAVAFLPPTLIASIYGMNFHFMPELSWPHGYPVAVGAMLLSAVLPLLYFKRRGWW